MVEGGLVTGIRAEGGYFRALEWGLVSLAHTELVFLAICKVKRLADLSRKRICYKYARLLMEASGELRNQAQS